MASKTIPKRSKKISADWPVWYDPASPVGSAVRYVASLSGYFNWVGFYALKGKVLQLGTYIGGATPHRSIAVGKGVCGMAVKEDRDLNVPDVTRFEGYLACNAVTRSELVVLVRDPKGRIRGQIDIDSRTPSAFGPEEETRVREVAAELGRLWPESGNRKN